ncbi:hypothetical protein S40285_03593 [Stachybotrys chlorohalonatus IBT 40285]|uniref:DUF676 domain-containing protein n=1 Tax=Stachybotrys chlorohalonatus (strain IBT 40285) TaxID=1283841 RepID=A0A084QBR9_STAC4|nr:hypothetical protein S40285_03593 [Stachybotrys chlorohalonata IBT 40285]
MGASTATQDHIGGTAKADHLCVLVHGLWGNPTHLTNIAKSLRAQNSADQLWLLLAKTNTGNFTYDGIERGGERVCAEIEEEMRLVESKGGKIKKLSVVGYSLGGLVSRYAIGLLHARGALDTVECMNYATFASPHLGVRSPLKGYGNHLWNVLVARTLSMSGRQLFTIDKFRDTGRPLLAVLADPNSTFMMGLRKFKRHTLYCNIVNDRVAVYYTTCISKTDPFSQNLDNIKVNYIDGGDDVIIDYNNPVATKSKPEVPVPPTMTGKLNQQVKRLPLILALTLLLPIGVVAYLINAIIQTVRSASRIRSHEAGKGGVQIENYRMPFMLDIQGEVEQAFEALNSSRTQEYLSPGDVERLADPGDRQTMARERRQSIPAQPTLALAPYQFDMIESLDSLKWRKYPVWIHKDRHSHAAIIVRMEKRTFDEGRLILRHFAEQEFLK